MSQSQPAWASGPAEILRHGLGLLKQDSDTNRRLAMIAIDNAVELTVKTYLGLPKRISGLSIPRKQYQEISESFPALLDALEQYASDKLEGIDLGEIEWYHRLRNQLYHQGNGLTVERDKVEVYAQLANVLFKNLFGATLVEHASSKFDLLGRFIDQWVEIEKIMTPAAGASSRLGPRSLTAAARQLHASGRLNTRDLQDFEDLRRVRNEVIHGAVDHRSVLTTDIVTRVDHLIDRLRDTGPSEPAA